MPCENCLSRREFLAKTAVAAAGVAVIATGCGDGQFGPTAATVLSQKVSVKVSTVAALATVGTLVQVGSAGAFVAVKKTGTNTFAAYTMICTHEQCPTVIRSNRFECDCHGSRFDNNGHVINGPADRDLSLIATSYDPATDTLTIG